MRILIIGGTRFIGLEVMRQLHGLGHELALFNRGNAGAPLPEGVSPIRGDRQELPKYRKRFLEFAPQLILDMIPFTQRQAEEVVGCFRGVAERLVAISSQDVYRAWGRLLGTEPGDPDPLPLTEDAPLRDTFFPYRKQAADSEALMYHYDKILVERAAQSEAELPGTILRLPMVYGPNDAQHRLFEQLRRMDDGRPAILLEQGIADWRWTRGYVENVAAAIVAAVTNPVASGRTYNVGESETLSMQQWIRAIAQAAGWSGEIMKLPGEQLPSHLHSSINTAQSLVTDNNRLSRELNFVEIVSREEALRRTVAWEREHPPADYDLKLFDYPAEDALLAQRRGGRC
ncbi:MAG: NAD-dependent epimerase/dehydratase family protein [Candidatus Delongbacteria bacterium]|nr:NAD-dependent epimerase/dehydratase family protein [Candidatus Delongbacteria bacterium]